jgi:mannose-1-phosphate guanylyltransferase/phosphomannomutase
VYDFGRDVFPGLLAEGMQVAGYVIEDFLIDIGLPEKYEEANQVVLSMAR